ncbi:MAG: DUF1501 domain-containing protein [Crocinitomicaceae bacterium]
MKRRDFVKNISLASLSTPFVLNKFNFQTVTKPLFKVEKNMEDRVLVVIRLGGGNDGLNTVIPLDGYDTLVNHRSNVILPESSLIKLNDDIAFHPSMNGMGNLFNEGKLAIIQNVGYPNQNRSHFRSTDIWDTGILDPNTTSGWLGRNFDQQYPNFPNDYPSNDYPDPFAIAMGSQVSATCQGLMGNFSHTVSNPNDTFNLSQSTVVDDGTYYGSHLDYLSTIIAQTNEYGSRVYSATNSGSSLSTKYDENNSLATQLKYVAQMISGGLKTKVYVLHIDGFDTHDGQVITTDATQGTHTDLLKKLSDAIEAFQDDLKLLGLEEKVAGMTYSEFGRQIASNASYGTDHGDAAPMFLFGSCIGQSVVGSNPQINDQLQKQEGVAMDIDFRDVYATILKNWFNVDTNEIQSLFEHQVTFYGMLGACNVGIDELAQEEDNLLLYPNPVSSTSTLKITTQNGPVRIEVINMAGAVIKVVFEGNLTAKEHHIPLDFSEIKAGSYFVNVIERDKNQHVRFVKTE